MKGMPGERQGQERISMASIQQSAVRMNLTEL